MTIIGILDIFLWSFRVLHPVVVLYSHAIRDSAFRVRSFLYFLVAIAYLNVECADTHVYTKMVFSAVTCSAPNFFVDQHVFQVSYFISLPVRSCRLLCSLTVVLGFGTVFTGVGLSLDPSLGLAFWRGGPSHDFVEQDVSLRCGVPAFLLGFWQNNKDNNNCSF